MENLDHIRHDATARYFNSALLERARRSCWGVRFSPYAAPYRTNSVRQPFKNVYRETGGVVRGILDSLLESDDYDL